ncbi:flagellar export chaperone FliS [Bdellovibrio sp. HCB185ZH]|uniref:flagellar export chaperone FliS n=1 Tax=Bdellovibrio TaxID=958 RepID=UPI00115AD013|nr:MULTISPECIES: flagellar export chaperone FliS [unclassified Bdellovibrio]QDK44137.1 flagellar export chaperone FliS [Bdellovibrio sp. ZAP7]QLY25972.1 flagellar export chaperone FliS [Bdellovibrio sp. KM01]
MNKNAYQKYKQTSVQSASKEKILLMLYEGAIKFTKLAVKAIEEKKIADRGQNIGRAFDIIMELNNTLDHKVGGDVANQLEQLYMFMMEQYTKANISGDAAPLHANLKLLNTLYDGWVQAVEKLKKESDDGKKAG